MEASGAGWRWLCVAVLGAGAGEWGWGGRHGALGCPHLQGWEGRKKKRKRKRGRREGKAAMAASGQGAGPDILWGARLWPPALWLGLRTGGGFGHPELAQHPGPLAWPWHQLGVPELWPRCATMAQPPRWHRWRAAQPPAVVQDPGGARAAPMPRAAWCEVSMSDLEFQIFGCGGLVSLGLLSPSVN